MTSVMPNPNETETPWHSSPYQALPKIHVQNASLEIAKCSVPVTTKTISGRKIIPFITEKYEGFDINLPEDCLLAEALVESNLATLPKIIIRT